MPQYGAFQIGTPHHSHTTCLSVCLVFRLFVRFTYLMATRHSTNKACLWNHIMNFEGLLVIEEQKDIFPAGLPSATTKPRVPGCLLSCSRMPEACCALMQAFMNQYLAHDSSHLHCTSTQTCSRLKCVSADAHSFSDLYFTGWDIDGDGQVRLQQKGGQATVRQQPSLALPCPSIQA